MTATADRAVLLTGVTGFVGIELLARYLERGDHEVFALVRAADDAAARERVAAALRNVGVDPAAHARRLHPIAADIERAGLGLADERRSDLAERVSAIVHSAASVSFTVGLEQSRAINVRGTREVLELAALAHERGGLERFAYVSTAYVAGTHHGRFAEDQLDVDQRFRNAYERSKHEAEHLVRSYVGLPIQIFRPSIIVGERDTGWTPSFNVLYSPLKAFVRGALPFLPADGDAPVDVVPVDYVADAVFTLAGAPLEEPAETFHLVAGPRATSVARLAETAASHLRRRPPRIVPARLYRWLVHPVLKRTGPEARRRALDRSEVFFPYFTMRVRFDDRRARARLAPQGIEPPPVERYLDRLIDFARRADWGRRPLPRRPAPGGRSR